MEKEAAEITMENIKRFWLFGSQHYFFQLEVGLLLFANISASKNKVGISFGLQYSYINMHYDQVFKRLETNELVRRS